ncbi:MAG: hypothetical protein GC150_16595 [Rhizobiales bacterium]|nr:hypothetical protein [Hyphomicrobiales bacterium]
MGADLKSRRQEIVRHGEKQGRLDQFVGFYLDRIFADWAHRPEMHVVSVIARSPASPVARAVASNAPDLLSAGIVIRVVFAQLEPTDLMGEWTDIALVAAESDAGSSVEFALIGNQALVDAHEVIVLGADMSWCGDAMRRDPLLRDTVEVYDPCCPRSATLNRRSFEALWTRSEIIRVATPVRRAEPQPAPVEATETPALQPGELPSTTLASTRH